MLLTCRQTQWDAPAWDVMVDDEDDMDLGTPTNDEIRVSFVSAFVENFFRFYSPAYIIHAFAHDEHHCVRQLCGL